MGNNIRHPCENHWKVIRKTEDIIGIPWDSHEQTIGKPFEKPLDNHGKTIFQKHGTTIGKPLGAQKINRKTMGNQRKTRGKAWEHSSTSIENHGKQHRTTIP
jgi:hypothetical protein